MTTNTIAHRGFAGRFPENTVTAVEQAGPAGADAVEIDVMPTADGDPVVFHDRRLDEGPRSRGITDGAGVVWEQPTAVVTGARVLGTDQRVPTLEAVLDALPPDVGLNVELKNPGSDDVRPGDLLADDARTEAVTRWRPFVERVIGVVDETDCEPLYSSLCGGALAALSTLDPAAERAAVVSPETPAAGVEMARRHDVDAVHAPVSLADSDRVRAVARDLDVPINVWTVRDWQDARAARSAGADGVFADYPGLV